MLPLCWVYDLVWVLMYLPSLPAAGLNAGDEILQLNGKPSSSLTFADMKVAFSQASLALTVSALPPVERRQLCYLPPRRSDAAEELYTDIFSQSQGESDAMGERELV